MNWALEQTTGSPAAKSVLLILANRADHSGKCWPGIEGISKQTELSERSVIRHIQSLRAGRLICITHRGGTGSGRKSNVYQLHLAPKCQYCTLGLSDNDDRQSDIDDRQSVALTPEPLEEPSKNHQRASKRCPEDFTVTVQMYEWAYSDCGLIAEVVNFETDKFRDHTFATARKDWPATWRNWMRRAKKEVSRGTSKFDQLMDEIDGQR